MRMAPGAYGSHLIMRKAFMRLMDLTIENWFCHERMSASFAAGINGIVGRNGSGKSSLIEALRFAVIGDAAVPGTKESYIRRGSKSFKVQLTFEHCGGLCTLQRSHPPARNRLVLPDGSQYTKSDEIIAQLESMLGTRSSVLDHYIFVAQHALDAFLFQTPSERLRLFQEIFGLLEFETMHQLLGEELASIKLTPLLEHEHERRSQELSAVESHIRSLESAHAKLVEKHEALVAKQQRLHAHELAVERMKAYEVHAHAHKALLAKQAKLEDALATTSAAIDKLEAELAALDAAHAEQRLSEYAAASHAAQKAADEHRRLQDIRAHLEAKIAELLESLRSDALLLKQLQDHEHAAVVLRGSADVNVIRSLESWMRERSYQLLTAVQYGFPSPPDELAALIARRLSAKEALDRAELALSSDKKLLELQAAHKQTEKALKVLRHSMECPLCHRPIGQDIIAQQEDELKRLTSEMLARRTLLVEAVREASDAFYAADIEVKELEHKLSKEFIDMESALKRGIEAVRSLGDLVVELQQVHERMESAMRAMLVDLADDAEVASWKATVERAHELQRLLSAAKAGRDKDVKALSELVAERKRIEAQLAACAVDDSHKLALLSDEERAELMSAVAGLHASAAAVNDSLAQLSAAKGQRDMLLRHIEQLSVRMREERVAKEWSDICGTVRDVVHVQRLPRRLMSAFVERINSLSSKYLQIFDPGFTVRLTSDLEFIATDSKTGHEIPAARLSGGQRVVASICFRLAAVDIFAKDVGLLIIDEPTNHLDVHNISYLQSLLAKLKLLPDRNKKQIIVVTHAEQLMDFCDHIIRV